MIWTKIAHKIKNGWKKLCFRPIRVFVFHQVSAVFDASTMWECDWTEVTQFQRNILFLKREYQFITLQEATAKLQNDRFRLRKYAVLTCDDGWESILSILQWLSEQHIPITLFLNPTSIKGIECREKGMNKLLTEQMIFSLVHKYDNITIGSHGWNHDDCIRQTDQQFQISVTKSEEYLSTFHSYIPFFAYPCGRHTAFQDYFLCSKSMIPVYCDGAINYRWEKCVHRECIDGIKLDN